MTPFTAPKESLGNLSAEAVAALLASTGDIALVLDPKGQVRDVSFSTEDLSREWGGRWLGLPWVETVTSESRGKVESLLKEAAAGTAPRWRHVNHPSTRGGTDVPIQYTAVKVGKEGRVIAVGRDLRALSALQQRLVEAQQSVERDYARLRQMELRYRLLFQATPEALLILDAASFVVTEANPSAIALLGGPAVKLVSRPLTESFDGESTPILQTLLAGVRATGRPDSAQATAAADGRMLTVSASLFRQDGVTLFLVRLAPESAAHAIPPSPHPSLGTVLDRLPDGFVVTDPEGRILDVNPAFLDLAQLATEEQARGESFERWLGRPGVDLSVLIANLRQHGTVRLYSTTVRGEYGATAEVEVSAAAVPAPGGGGPCLAYILRSVGRRLSAEPRRQDLPRSVEQLKELVGRVPLKDLVRETTDVVERLCIEAALELTGDNRASAAEILGLSRQSLYVKLRRYGLGDGEGEE